MTITKSLVRTYPKWTLYGTESPCCKKPIIATDVITETGKAKDISFTPTSMTFCSKCHAIIDEHASSQYQPPGVLPKDATDPTPPTAPALPLNSTKTWRAVIKRVIDADTIEVTFDLGFKIYHTARLRIANVDAQEVGTPLGDQAAREVRAALEGKEATITTYQQQDKYGRFIAAIDTEVLGDLAAWIRMNGFAK